MWQTGKFCGCGWRRGGGDSPSSPFHSFVAPAACGQAKFWYTRHYSDAHIFPHSKKDTLKKLVCTYIKVLKRNYLRNAYSSALSRS